MSALTEDGDAAPMRHGIGEAELDEFDFVNKIGFSNLLKPSFAAPSTVRRSLAVGLEAILVMQHSRWTDSQTAEPMDTSDHQKSTHCWVAKPSEGRGMDRRGSIGPTQDIGRPTSDLSSRRAPVLATGLVHANAVPSNTDAGRSVAEEADHAFASFERDRAEAETARMGAQVVDCFAEIGSLQEALALQAAEHADLKTAYERQGAQLALAQRRIAELEKGFAWVAPGRSRLRDRLFGSFGADREPRKR